VADVDGSRRALAEALGAAWSEPQAILHADADVLAPCALGAILDVETVPALRAKVVAGAANNQLADPAIAELLARRGVLWVPDFVANAGGIVNIAGELAPGGYDEARAEADVRAIAGTVRKVLDEAAAAEITPLAAAMAIARRRLPASPDAARPVAR